MIPIFKRILSGMLSLTIAVSVVPVITTYADESTELYPYTMFAASSDEGAINAVIHLYKGNTLLNTYHVPQNETGSVWHAFDIDSIGIHAVNSFYGAGAGDVK